MNIHPYLLALAMTAGTASAQSLSPRTSIVVAHAAAGQASTLRAAQEDSPQVTVFLTLDTAKADWTALHALADHLGASTLLADGRTLLTARVSPSRLEQLGRVEGVSYVQLTAAARQMLDVARPEVGADLTQAGQQLERAYTGRGVVVGIVDDGFDYTHAAFRSREDGTLRIRRVWEQGSTAFEGCSAPEKYGYGIELATEEAITRASGDDDVNSHGTHVAAIAAGQDSHYDGRLQGMAPDADIVLVSLDRSNTTSADISNAVAYIFDYAEQQGKPCVVNLSLGNHEGPHDGTSPFDVMADQLQGKGRLIVGSAGNHRADAFHVSRTFASADDAALRTFLDYKQKPSASNVGGSVEVWGEPTADFEVVLSAYSLYNHADKQEVVVWPAESADPQEVKLGSYVTGSFTVVAEHSALNGKPHVLIESNVSGLRNNYAVALTVRPKSAGQVDVWADNAWLGLASNDEEGFTAPDASMSTIAEIGGTAKRILSVGAYTTRPDLTLQDGSSYTLSETTGQISSFSSYGPTADGRMKPQVAAPGCAIISAVSQNDASGTQLLAESFEADGRTHAYGYMQGTSMAAPLVAGVVAQWLEACPDLTPEDLADVVSATARHDDATGQEASMSWGYGKVDAYAGLLQCLSIASAGITPVDAQMEADVQWQGGVLTVQPLAASRLAVRVYDQQGRQALNADLGLLAAGQTRRIDLSGLAHGVYLVSLSSGKSQRVYKVAL